MTNSQAWPAPVALVPPEPGDFCCIPVAGKIGAGIEFGQFLAGDRFQPYDHAEIYTGQPDEAGPHGYTYSAYPSNGKGGLTGKRPLPCEPARLPGALWSSGIIDLTGPQRALVTAWCVAHPDVPYSWVDYGALALHALRIPAPGLRGFIASTRSLICSQYVDTALTASGVHLFADGRWPGYVKPGDLAGLLQGLIAERLLFPGSPAGG